MRVAYLFVFTLLFLSCKEKQLETFKVMAWNILHGANDIPNGQEKAIEIIKEINPDIILMVETYGSGKRIADTLGYNFHLIAPEGTALDDKRTNLSIYSKFPFGERIDTDFPFYLGGREILVYNKKIRFFSNWFHYLPWENEPEKMDKTSDELLAWEKSGKRNQMIQKVLPYIKQYTNQTDSIPMIFGGDMNSPSHLDWGANTKSIHNNLVVSWSATKTLEDIGLVDSFRTLNTNPISHPGITWDSEGVNDSHRIDYIFHKGASLKPIKSETYNAYFNRPIKINDKIITYPSDHGFVVTTFQLLKN